MYLSRITLHTGQLSPAQLLHLVDRGEYVMHQWLWDLFPGGKERQFLYRREELQGAFRFFVLSQERPAESDTFTIECRSFAPELCTGQQLCFNLRANPTICKAGKRHDLLMEAKRQVRGQAEGSDVWLHQQQAALDWLAAQGERSGFTLLDTSVDAYRQQQLRRCIWPPRWEHCWSGSVKRAFAFTPPDNPVGRGQINYSTRQSWL